MGMETIAEFVENDEIKACSERSMLTMRKAMVSVSQCHLPTYVKIKIKIDNSFNVSHIHHFQPEPDEVELPIRLNNPFNNRPHALAILAANLLQKKLDQTPALSVKLAGDDCGKMFGVLVVQMTQEKQDTWRASLACSISNGLFQGSCHRFLILKSR